MNVLIKFSESIKAVNKGGRIQEVIYTINCCLDKDMNILKDKIDYNYKMIYK